MAAALDAAAGDVVAFLDADVANTTPAFVTGLLGPLLTVDDVDAGQGLLHPSAPRRADRGRPGDRAGGPSRARAALPRALRRAPAAGRRDGGHRWVFEKVGFADGYGVELGLLIDVAQTLGRGPCWPRSTWVSASTATGRCTSCALRPSTCCAPRSSAAAPVPRWPCRHVSRTVVVSNRGPLSFRRDRRRRARARAGRRRARLVAAPAARRQRHDVGLRDDGGGRPRGRRPGAHG